MFASDTLVSMGDIDKFLPAGMTDARNDEIREMLDEDGFADIYAPKYYLI